MCDDGDELKAHAVRLLTQRAEESPAEGEERDKRAEVIFQVSVCGSCSLRAVHGESTHCRVIRHATELCASTNKTSFSFDCLCCGRKWHRIHSLLFFYSNENETILFGFQLRRQRLLIIEPMIGEVQTISTRAETANACPCACFLSTPLVLGSPSVIGLCFANRFLRK